MSKNPYTGERESISVQPLRDLSFYPALSFSWRKINMENH